MPAAHDIYASQLRAYRRGYALYHPEPPEGDIPVQIGDVGYTKQGAFCRLFNVCRPANDPSHEELGVPEGFQLLNMGRILTYGRELEPGPLHGETISRTSFDIGAHGALVLPLDASFHFHCTSYQGAILMLESQMSRETALQEVNFLEYLRKHCRSWYRWALGKGIPVQFGDIMLVTECSKTAAWASAVYSQCSSDFGLSFSVGGVFSPIPNNLGVTTGHERSGSVQHRRSQRVIGPSDVERIGNDQTVFIKAYRPGLRESFSQSFASTVMKFMNRSPKHHQMQDPPSSPSAPRAGGSPTPGRHPSSLQPSSDDEPGSLVEDSDFVSSLSPEYPDFQPAVALLAHAMETTDAEIVIVHDDEWCGADDWDTTRLIDEYVEFFTGELLDQTILDNLEPLNDQNLNDQDLRDVLFDEPAPEFQPCIQSHDLLEPPRSPSIQHDPPNDARPSNSSLETQKLAERETMVQKDIISALNAGILIGTEGGNCGVLNNLAKRCGFTNRYVTVQNGPPSNPTWTAKVYVDAFEYGTGTGTSQGDAKTTAAYNALRRLARISDG